MDGKKFSGFTLWSENEDLVKESPKPKFRRVRKCEALDYMIKFINGKYPGKIRTAFDIISGDGLFTEYLLQIHGLEKLRLNDPSEDHYKELRRRFGNDPRITRIFNLPPFHACLNGMTDLTIINFPDFSWSKTELANEFLEWLKYNRQWMNLLLYTDTFPRSQEEFLEYPRVIEKNLSMKIVTHYPYNEHRLVLVEYQ